MDASKSLFLIDYIASFHASAIRMEVTLPQTSPHLGMLIIRILGFLKKREPYDAEHIK